MRKLIILGVTGSIGKSTLKVVEKFPDKFKILGISCRSRIRELAEIAEKFEVPYIVVENKDLAENLKEILSYSPTIWYGDEGLKKLVTLENAEIIVVGISGIKALIPTYYALKAGKRVAIANKECLIVAGHILRKVEEETGAELLPVDSEHSSIFQLLLKEKKDFVKKIILTASGGPFYRWNKEEFKKITPEMAINHPTWKMGAKISVDSATLMNKGFEVLEAKVLFDFPLEKIEILIHPQSLVHGIIELIDGSMMMHLSFPDMQIPISYAINYPERLELNLNFLDLAQIGTLIFEKPDFEKFPCLRLAYEVGKKEGFYPLILEAADEVVVEAFLKNIITFDEIPYFLEETVKNFKLPSEISEKNITIEQILSLHEKICKFTEELIKNKKGVR